MKLVILLGAVLCLATSASAGRWTERLNSASDNIRNTTSSWFKNSRRQKYDSDLWFCHGKPCPAFSTIANTTSYVVRKYAAGASNTGISPHQAPGRQVHGLLSSSETAAYACWTGASQVNRCTLAVCM